VKKKLFSRFFKDIYDKFICLIFFRSLHVVMENLLFEDYLEINYRDPLKTNAALISEKIFLVHALNNMLSILSKDFY